MISLLGPAARRCEASRAASPTLLARVARLAGRYGLLGAVRCLVSSYLTNLVGSLLLVGLMVGGEVYKGRSDFVIE